MEDMNMQKLSNSSILKIISKLLILLASAKLISLVLLYILPSDGVELNIEESYQPKYQRIDFRNLLNTTQSTTQGKKETVQSGVGITNMVLKGLYGTKNGGFIIVALKSNVKNTSMVEVGDIYSGYKLIEIKKSSAIFNKNSTKYTLYLDDLKLDSKYSKANSYDTSENELVSQKIVSKNDINYYAKNPKEIWKEISIMEIKDGKKIKGFKVMRIKPNSKMATLGLKKNDLIIKANNVVLKSYRDALNIYTKIKNIDVIQLVVVRNGIEKEIVYEIK
jgi:type II secretion system protein C